MGLRREHPPPFIYFTLGGIVCFDYSDVAHELTIQNRVQEKKQGPLSIVLSCSTAHCKDIPPKNYLFSKLVEI